MTMVTRTIKQNKNKVFQANAGEGPRWLCSVPVRQQVSTSAPKASTAFTSVPRTHLFAVNNKPRLATIFTVLKSQL